MCDLGKCSWSVGTHWNASLLPPALSLSLSPFLLSMDKRREEEPIRKQVKWKKRGKSNRCFLQCVFFFFLSFILSFPFFFRVRPKHAEGGGSRGSRGSKEGPGSPLPGILRRVKQISKRSYPPTTQRVSERELTVSSTEERSEEVLQLVNVKRRNKT